MDKRTNENVEKGCQRLMELGMQLGFEVKRLSWDPAYKGIDDFLLAKKKK